MDAKPQRPMRSIRIRNDENLPPDNALVKTIHHRNKSSPALTMMNGTTQYKPGTKRTAFGDVSNVAPIARPSKDDSTLPAKVTLQPPFKSNHVVQERKSTTFLRPPQRPISVSSLRSLLTGSSSNASQESAPKIQVHETTLVSQPANSRKLLTKRNTIIFKDVPLDPVQEHEPSIVVTAEKLQRPEPLNSLSHFQPQSEIKAPSPLSTTSATVDTIKEIIPVSSDTILPSIDTVSLEPTKRAISFNSDPHLPLPTQDQQQKIDDTIEEACEPHLIMPSLSTLLLPPATSYPSLEIPVAQPATSTSLSTVETLDKDHLLYQPARPEPEEYWEEEDEDVIEEEGYVTARSYRSKGDNTTGGATTVLFPQVNQRAKKELCAAKHLVEATRTAEEIEDESYDTSMVAEYGEEIFDYMKQLEVKMLPNAHYMDNQHEIQWSMRAVLMDWLVQVHHRFNLLPETLFLCVNYIDRFLSCKIVSLGKLQLVGATAIFIAAKYEEINCPSVQEIVYMVDGGYSVDEILKAERFMLTMLQFELGWPGPMSFLRRISKADDYDLETRTLAKYFLEVTIMDERFIGSPPSFAAGASHCLARLMLRKGTWTPHHVYYSGYTFSQLRPLVKLLLECCEDPRKHHSAVYNKYCDKRYKRASAFVETELQRGFQLPEATSIKPIAQPSLQTYFDSLSYFRA